MKVEVRFNMSSSNINNPYVSTFVENGGNQLLSPYYNGDDFDPIGRDVELEILANFLNNNAHKSWVLVDGTPGSGKTRLCYYLGLLASRKISSKPLITPINFEWSVSYKYSEGLNFDREKETFNKSVLGKSFAKSMHIL